MWLNVGVRTFLSVCTLCANEGVCVRSCLRVCVLKFTLSFVVPVPECVMVLSFLGDVAALARRFQCLCVAIHFVVFVSDCVMIAFMFRYVWIPACAHLCECVLCAVFKFVCKRAIV